jgi:serine/threonine-protein kinase
MAPEQIEGHEADARADIWALGVVVYEMLTGARPFDGQSPASVIGSILKDTPLPLSARQPLAPRALDHVVDRCLQKDRDERWQSVADLRFAITSVLSGIEPTTPPSRAEGSRPPRNLGFAALALVIFAAGVGFGSRYLTHTLAAPTVVQFDVLPSIDTLLSPAPVASTAQLALSADGRRLAYVAQKRSL